MSTSDTPRLGLVNHGGFFSPYYLFELLARQHGEELDPEGREANRRPLRHLFRRAEERLGAGSSPGEAWTAWHRELLEALGFTSAVLRRLSTPIETVRHDAVPISHGVFSPLPSEEGTEGEGEALLVFVDCHGFATDLDRGRYPAGPDVTEEPIARAIEFALDHNSTRWAIVLAGSEMRLYRKGGSVARQFLQVNFPALFDADRADEWTAFWGLLRYDVFLPGADGSCLLDRVLEESQRHATRIADDLRENIVLAVEAILQGILDDPANAPLLPRAAAQERGGAGAQGGWLPELFEETLYFLYRLLFILYAESRDLLPVGESLVYRDTFSLEHLRDLADRPLPPDAADRTYFIESIRTLLRMLQNGYPSSPFGGGAHAPFRIDAFNGQLFDSRRTALLDRCRIPDRAMHAAIAELSLSRPRRRNDRRERFSYADLGVDQLGSIYEGLLVFEPALVTEETVLARVRGEERWVTRSQAEENNLDMAAGPDGYPVVRRPGQFILRLWGGRRKGSGSYYTPQEITSFLVKEALEPLVMPIIAGCAERDERGRPRQHSEEILDLTVCDPAMGSGAFLIQACRYLAEAYGRARIAEGLDEDARISPEEFAAYKRLVAERCLYGVDLNPMAVELAKVSLWLETLARGKPLDFLDAHLRCGNSLIGAPLRNAEGKFSIERLLTIPDAALKEVSKEATPEEKAAARDRMKRNREDVKRLAKQKSGQMTLASDWGVLSLQTIEDALRDTLTRRAALERSDADLLPAEAVALVHEKEQAFEHLLTDPQGAYLKLRTLCDLWCAVWFWPHPSPNGRGAGDEGEIPPPTTAVFLELASALLGTGDCSLSEAERQAYWRTVKQVWQEQRFFHWELEFPEVWREKNGRPKKNGGFAAIVGNPPWDTVKLNSREFWSNYEPLYRHFGKDEARSVVGRLRADDTIEATWQKYARTVAQTGQLFRSSGNFQFQGGGDINTYKLFAEHIFYLLSEQGRASLVLPTGLYADLGTADLRRVLFGQASVSYLLTFSNERHIFPGIDHRFKFTLLCMGKGNTTNCFDACFIVDVREAVGLQELAPLLGNPKSRTVAINIETVRRFSPESLRVLEFRRDKDIAIALDINELPALVNEQALGWRVEFASEFHMSGDRDLFRSSKPENGSRPLYEGRMIHQFDAMAKYWVSGRGRSAIWETPGFLERASRNAPWRPQWWVEDEEVHPGLQAHVMRTIVRVGVARITGQTNERTVQSALLPFDAACGDSITTIRIARAGKPSLDDALFLMAVLNSFVVDFYVRLQVSTVLSYWLLENIAVPPLGNDEPRRRRVIQFSEKLATLGGVPVYDEYALHPVLEPIARAQLRAAIDALVADLYDLSESDSAYILSTFPLLDRDQPPLPGEPKSYITRDMALLELFKLRGLNPPDDIVTFHREASVNIAAITGPVRGLEERVRQALALGAVAYVPGGRGGRGEEEEEVKEEEGMEEEDE